jgi:hypothetical protein
MEDLKSSSFINLRPEVVRLRAMRQLLNLVMLFCCFLGGYGLEGGSVLFIQQKLFFG